MEKKNIRVLMSKIGMDGHWRGIVTVSKGLMEAGMEVIFGGFQNILQIVKTAEEEDVDVIGLSIHSGAHIEWTQKLIDSLKEKGREKDFLILVGGVIPDGDDVKLKEIGVSDVFGPGTAMSTIVDSIKSNVPAIQKLSLS